LHDIKNFYGRISFGHIIFILGHEIGHYQKGHYDTFYRNKKTVESDGFLEIHDDHVTARISGYKTFLMKRAFTRNQELEADKVGVDSLLNARIDLVEGAEVLQYLTNLDAQNRKLVEHSPNPQDKPSVVEVFRETIEILGEAITRSHPASLERENACRAYIRERNSAVDLSSGITWSELTSPSEDVSDLLDSQTKETELQRLVREISELPEFSAKKISEIVEKYRDSSFFGDIAAHAWMYTVTRYRVENSLCPLIPFGWLEALGADIKLSTAWDGLNSVKANQLVKLEQELSEGVRNFAIRHGLNPTHEVFFRITGLFGSREARSTWAQKIVRPATKEPEKFFEQLENLGRLKLDLTTTSLAFLEQLTENTDTKVADRARKIIQLCRNGEWDIRWPCIREALQEQLLDNLSDPRQIVPILEGIEKLVGDTAEWFEKNYERSLADEVVLWMAQKLEDQALTVDEAGDILEKIVNRKAVRSAPDGEVAQFDLIGFLIVSGVAAAIHPKQPKEAVDFIIATLPLPSNTRDLALMELASKYQDRNTDLRILPYLCLTGARPWLLRHRQAVESTASLSSAKETKSNKKGRAGLGANTSIVGVKAASSLATLEKMSAFSCDLPRTRFGNYVEYFIATRDFRGDRLRLALCSTLATPLLASPSFRKFTLPDLYAFERVAVAEYLKSTRSELSRHIEIVTSWLLGGNGSLMLGSYLVNPREYFSRLPSSELKDFVLLKALHGTIANLKNHLRLEMIYPAAEINALTSGLRIGDVLKNSQIDNLVRSVLKRLSFFGQAVADSYENAIYEADQEVLYKAILVAHIYKNEEEYFKLSNGLSSLDQVVIKRLIVPNPRSIATDYGTYAFLRRYPGGVADLSVNSGQAINTLLDYYPYPSSQRDHYLLQIFDRAIEVDSAFTNSVEALEIFDLIQQSLIKASLGKRIYDEALSADKSLERSFDRNLELLLRTHPPGTIARQEAIRQFCNGTDVRAPAVVTWEHYHLLMNSDQQATSQDARLQQLIESSSISLLRDLLSNPDYKIEEEEKVDTLLWILGERDKSKLVSCIELVENCSLDRLTSSKLHLSYTEKKLILCSVLSGPGGILRGSPESRSRFLDHLFSSFIAQKNICSDDERRAMKAAFDALMHYLDPDRAAEHLSTIILSHIESASFEELVRVGLGSIPVWGPRSGQYLVTQTSTLSGKPELANKLLSLTSRVPNGFSKTQLFELLVQQFGDLAHQIVPEIREVLGDGATSTVFKVLINEQHNQREAALAVLRPDTLRDLPVDGQAMYALVRTVESAPEIFNGIALNERMFTSVQHGLALDVDRPRCVRLMRNFSLQLSEFNKRNPGVKVTSPHVIDTVSIETASGKRDIPVSVGPFLLMDLASGESLDQILADKQVSAEEKEWLLKIVGTRLCEFLLYQLESSRKESDSASILHCDLHPGNIQILRSADSSNSIEISLLDLPVSIEISPELSNLCTEIISLATRADTEACTAFQRLVRWWNGLGTINTRDAENYMKQALILFTVRAEMSVPFEGIEQIAKGACELLRDSSKTMQQRLGTTLSYLQNSGLAMPEDLSTLLRGIAVSKYLFEAAEWEKLSPAIERLINKTNYEATGAPLDLDSIVIRISLVAQKLSIPVNVKDAELWADNLRDEPSSIGRIVRLTEYLVKHSTESDITKKSPTTTEIARALLDDDRILPLLIGSQSSEAISHFLDRGGSPDVSRWLKDYMRTIQIGIDQARETAINEKFGFSPTCWRRKLKAGTWVTGTNRKSGQMEHYLVACHDNQDPEFIPIAPPEDELQDILKSWWNRKSPLSSEQHKIVKRIINEVKPSPRLNFHALRTLLKDINVWDSQADGPGWIGMSALIHDLGQTMEQYLDDLDRTRSQLALDNSSINNLNSSDSPS
jgi:hypothetical protein